MESLKKLRNDPTEVGIFSDLDGTLCRIYEVPADAVITPEVKQILKSLTEKYALTCIVTGRDSDDARQIVGLDKIIYVGNHGLEWIENGKQHYALQAIDYLSIMEELGKRLLEVNNKDELTVEVKKLGVALHYRQAKNKQKMKDLLKEMLKGIVSKYPLKILEGRCVIELRPDLEINKGEAVKNIALRKGLKKVIYLGDDVTDVDVFKSLRKLRKEKHLETMSIGVASNEAHPLVIHESDFTVGDVRDVAYLLGTLANP
ncbi:MAG: trehalose-phosphatase [Actinomycetota bacterium]|nr:trehalose-phosphatase [Actinomycetota bacterium]